MACESCQMGLPCSGEAMGEDEQRFRLLGDADKNRNTFEDLLVGVSAGLGNAAARRQPTSDQAEEPEPSTIRILGMEYRASTVALVGGGAALGLALLWRR